MSSSTTIPPALMQPKGLGSLASPAAVTDMLIVVAFFAGLLVPVAILLVFFSSSQLRRRPVFVLNVFAIIAAWIFSGCMIYSLKMGILLVEISTTVPIVLAVLVFFIPTFVQSILLVRVLAVYPPRRLPWSRIFTIYTPIVLIKTARLIDQCFLTVNMVKATRGTPLGGLESGPVIWRQPYARVGWFLQIFDDTYVSILFLIRLWEGQRLSSRQGPVDTFVTTNWKNRSYPARIKALFWIAVFNFVFPVFFNIAQLVLVFRDRDYTHGVAIVFVNLFVIVIAVLCATIWCSEGSSFGSPSWQSTTRVGAAKADEVPIENNPQFAPRTRSDIAFSQDQISTMYALETKLPSLSS